MGCWGMGITQSDEYCEIYERFMKEYDEGKPVADITKDILGECLDEFEETDGVLHDVYFALGKAEWMCGGISEGVYQRICHIIENDENILFLRQLDATEADLKLRKKNLAKFLLSLRTPKGKARKRKLPEDKYVSQTKPQYPLLPKIQTGDVFAYRHNNRYRVFAIVRRRKIYGRPAAYAYAWRKEFREPPTYSELEQEYIMPIGYFFGETFPDENTYGFIGNISELKKLGSIDYPEVVNLAWKPATYALAKAQTLTECYPIELCLTLKELYERIQKRKEALEQMLKEKGW